MTTVMVSGCFDILHAGHLRFLKDARALGDTLIVCVANDKIVEQHKGRKAAVPVEHRAALLRELPSVDIVRITSECKQPGMDFKQVFNLFKPDVLAVTEDDQYEEPKRKLCEKRGIHYVQLPKTKPCFDAVSSTEIRRRVSGLDKVPVRVDFAGGWLDVPRLAIPGAHIVNCAVTPFMQSDGSPYEPGGGIGGSAAMAILKGQDGVATELKNGAGWQDPAVIAETGLCIWESGDTPRLKDRSSGEWLKGLMAIKWTGGKHDTPGLVDKPRRYNIIKEAGRLAWRAALNEHVRTLGQAVGKTHTAQVQEGMQPIGLPRGALACKYVGAGHGGYVLFLFEKQSNRDAFVQQDGAMAIEPFCRWANG